MGIDMSILLIVVGAILAWTVDVAVPGVHLYVVEWSPAVTGVVGLLVGLLAAGLDRPAGRGT